MKKRELTVLGSVGNGKVIGGQVTKTNEILGYLKQFDKNVFFVNVEKNHPLKTFLKIFNSIRESKNLCVILSSAGYFKILWFIVWLASIYKCNLHEIVIGGIRQQYLNKRRVRMEQSVKRIYVETEAMKNDYWKLGLKQTIVMANCKNFIPLEEEEVIDYCKARSGKGLKLCTFSRIDSTKGIDTALEILKRIHNKNISLDIYGPVDNSYQEEFQKILNDYNTMNFAWRGVIDTSRAQEILKHYDVLLFPTHWEGEGFPGTFVDAFSAALPILASNKKNFEGLVETGYNGFLVSEYNVDDFCEKILLLYNNPLLLREMKFNAWRSSYSYLTDHVLLTLKKEIYR